MKKQFLEAGRIVTVHGIAGEVRVQAWCDSNEFLTQFDTLYFNRGQEPVQVERARVHKNVVILKLAGIDDRNTAQTLRGRVLYLNRDDIELDEGTYFVQDLIGCRVVDFDDPQKEYGELTEVSQTGANDVYHIKEASGRVTLIPAIPDVIRETDVEAQLIRITPLKGLFDDED